MYIYITGGSQRPMASRSDARRPASLRALETTPWSRSPFAVTFIVRTMEFVSSYGGWKKSYTTKKMVETL